MKFLTPQRILPSDTYQIHFWHWKQSPEISTYPSDGSSTADGHCLVQALQPRMQFSRFRCRVKNGRNRKQRKDSSHWAQEMAEKALLKEHADQDQHQKNNAWNIRGKSEISRMQHGKDIPRACSSCFLINSCKAAKSNQKQNAVFDQRQFFCQSGLMRMGFFLRFLQIIP